MSMDAANKLLDKMEQDLVVGALDSLAVALADHDHQWTEGERCIYEAAVELIQSAKKGQKWLNCSQCKEEPYHFEFRDTSVDKYCWIVRPRRKSKCKQKCCQIVNYENAESARLEWNARQGIL